MWFIEVGDLERVFDFPIFVGNFIIPIDEVIFSSGIETTDQV